jgi:hypothetical protein
MNGIQLNEFHGGIKWYNLQDPTIPSHYRTESFNQMPYYNHMSYKPFKETNYEEMLNTTHFKLGDLLPTIRVDIIHLNDTYYERRWINNIIIGTREINRTNEDIGNILFVKSF